MQSLQPRVRRQVKIVRGKLVLAPPKGDRFRDVPLAEPVSLALSRHLASFPAVPVTLPWKVPDGKPVTVPLLFTSVTRRPISRNDFNRYTWRPALEAAGVIGPRPEGVKSWGPDRENGMHALRHSTLPPCCLMAWTSGRLPSTSATLTLASRCGSTRT